MYLFIFSTKEFFLVSNRIEVRDALVNKHVIKTAVWPHGRVELEPQFNLLVDLCVFRLRDGA